MKIILLLAAGLLWPLGASAQGFINFNTKAGTSTTSASGAVWAPVYLPEPEDPFLIKQGNTPTGIIAGAQTYNGGYVIGSGFTAQLWGGPANSTEDQLVLVASTTFRTQTATGVAGTVVPHNSYPSVPGVGAGFRAALQLRAWDNRGGTVTNWAQVTSPENDLVVRRGVSPLFISLSLGNEESTNRNLQGLQSFNLHLVPEPSAWALGFLGAGTLWLLRRRK